MASASRDEAREKRRDGIRHAEHVGSEDLGHERPIFAEASKR